MKLLVGLGNPGRKYERTRHNLGFMVVDRIAAANGVQIDKRSCDALVGKSIIDYHPVLLAKPQTYMNLSGESVKRLMQRVGGKPEDLIVIYDDLDLPFGRIRIRPRGSSAGHRGLQSIVENLAGVPFYRVRVGIGRPPAGVDPVDFVLQRFNSEELSQLEEIIERACAGVVCLIREGGKRAMEQFNRAS